MKVPLRSSSKIAHQSQGLKRCNITCCHVSLLVCTRLSIKHLTDLDSFNPHDAFAVGRGSDKPILQMAQSGYGTHPWSLNQHKAEAGFKPTSSDCEV